MKPRTYSALQAPSAPWLLRMVASHSEITDELGALQADEKGPFVVRFLRGKKMSTLHGLFDEFAAAMQFPYYFGSNWAAFDECLSDLAWLPARGYALVVFDSADLLSYDVRQLDTFVEVVERVCAGWSTPVTEGQPWDRPAAPFHVIFQSTTDDEHTLAAKILAIPVWSKNRNGGRRP